MFLFLRVLAVELNIYSLYFAMFSDKDTAQSLGIHWIDLEVRPVILVCGQLYYVGAARSTMQCGGSQMVF